MSADLIAGPPVDALTPEDLVAEVPASPYVERLLLYGIVLSLPVLSLQPVQVLGFLSVVDYLFLPLLLIWGVRKLNTRERILLPSCFRSPLWLLLIGGLVATVFAANPAASAFGILVSLRFYLLYRIMLDNVDCADRLRTVLLLLAVGLVLSSALGFFQGVLGVNITFIQGDLNQNVSASIGGRTVVRSIGTFANSLNFANYLSVTLFTLALIRVRWSSLQRVSTIVLVLIAVFALLQTLSRGPILSTAIGALVFWGAGASRKRMPQVVAVAAFLASLIVLPVFRSGIAESILGESLLVRFAAVVERFDLNIRYGLWQEAAASAKDHIVGVGLRNSDYDVRWPQAAKAIPGYFPYETRGWKPFNFHFENVYLAVYMNIGVVGLVGFLILVYRMVSIPFRTFRVSSDASIRVLSRVLVAANVAFALNMVTNPAVLSDLRIMMLFWVMLSCVAVLAKVAPPQFPETRTEAVIG